MKKVLLLILAISMMFVLVACGGEKDGGESDGSEYTVEKPLVFKVGHDGVIDSPVHRAALDFKEKVEKESENRIKVELYPNAELGNAGQMLDLIGMGSMDLASVEASELGLHNEKLSFLSLPFLFESYEQAVELVYTPGAPFYELFQEEANKNNFHTLGFQYYGLRCVANNKREIKVAGDMKDLKMRVMSTPTAVATFEALGSNVTPLAFAEVYTALQQKVVEGQDNPPTLFLEMNFQEVQKYYSLTEHMVSVGVNVVNLEKFEALPEEFQEIIASASEEHLAKQEREETRSDEEDAIKAIAEAGLTVTKIEDKSSFIEATKSVYDDLGKTFGEEFMDKVYKILGR